MKTVGAWEATWAPAAAKTSRRNPEIGNLYFIVVILSGKKGREIVAPSPFCDNGLEHGSMQYRRSIRSPRHHGTGGRIAPSGWLPGVAAGRVVGSANEEHGRVVASRQAGGRAGGRRLTTFIRCWLWQVVQITTARVVVSARLTKKP